jgi:hypothetical protein
VHLWGPVQATRTKGEPNVYVFTITSPDFEHFEAPFVLHVQNGGDGLAPVEGSTDPEEASSASIVVDGEEIFGPSDFSQQVSNLSAEITMADGSELTVWLASKPGSGLTIWVEGTLRPGRAVIGEEGGTLVSEDGSLTVTVPAGAFEGEAVVSALPSEAEPPEEVLGERLGASVELGPEGVVFSVPVTIALDFTDLLPQIDDPQKLQVVHWDDAGTFVDIIDPVIDLGSHTATATLHHFSHLKLIKSPWEYTFCSSGSISVCGAIIMSTTDNGEGGTVVGLSVQNREGMADYPQAVASEFYNIVWALKDDPAGFPDGSSPTFQDQLVPTLTEGATTVNGDPAGWDWYIDDRVGGSLLFQVLPHRADGEFVALGLFGCTLLPDFTYPANPRPGYQTCNGGWLNFSFTTDFKWDVSQIAAIGIGAVGETGNGEACTKVLDPVATIPGFFAYRETVCPLEGNSCGGLEVKVPSNCASTIQEGIDVVDPGGRVLVSKGEYFETLVIDKGLTLEGNGPPQPTYLKVLGDAGGNPVPVSAIYVTATDPVVIRNLAVECNCNPPNDGIIQSSRDVAVDLTVEATTILGTGGTEYGALSGVVVDYNNNVHGTDDRAKLVVRNSIIRGTSPGALATGVFGPGDVDALVEGNTVSHTWFSCIQVQSRANADILGNDVDNCGRVGGIRADTHGMVNIVGNNVRNSTQSNIREGIFIGGEGPGSVEHNTVIDYIQPGASSEYAAGIVIAYRRTVPVRFNDISGNAIAGLRLRAVTDPTSIDATCNWWGATDGPSGDHSGSGDAVLGPVPVVPFATSPIAGTSQTTCSGGL